jgi:hypothetical protein
MKRTTALLAAIALCAMCSVHADYSVEDKGTWPESWPKELEPLRKQSRTFEGPEVPLLHYEVPFTKREDFEAAWPHLLKVKSKGAPIFLMRAPYTKVFKLKAGVVIHCPPAGADIRANAEVPLAGVPHDRGRWMRTNHIELVVDGEIVDLNRIALPADTPIIDQRFEDGGNKAPDRRGGGKRGSANGSPPAAAP